MRTPGGIEKGKQRIFTEGTHVIVSGNFYHHFLFMKEIIK
jgi:hypothetical protein